MASPQMSAEHAEGEWDEVMGVIRRCIDHVAEARPRVSGVVKIDHRREDPGGRLRSKVARIEDAIG